MSADAGLALRVRSVVADPPDVRTVVLGADLARPLPSFAPGSHVIIDCGGKHNAYSLIGDGLWPQTYAVSVLLAPGGVGSRWVHQLEVGDQVDVSRPRSRFAPVLRARKHLLVAGGIGVTALLPHYRAAVRQRRPVEMIYGHRPGAGAHIDELRTLAGPAGLAEHHDRNGLRAAVVEALARQPLGTHLYVCGPPALIDFCLRQAGDLGWPPERLHHERFRAADSAPGRPFRLRLRRSDREIAVPADLSMLDALDRAGVRIDRQCRQGVCGECRAPVSAGRPEHRDLYLTDAERESGLSVMACVSRAADDELELDL